MALYDTLVAAIGTAQKAADAATLGTLRLLKNTIDTKVKDGIELSDGLVASCALAEIKKRREAANLYRQGNSVEKADAEEAEAEIIATYAPAQLSPDELSVLVDQAISTTGATTPADMGQVMTALRQTVGQNADMGQVSQMVRERLAK
jgi:hypothetical protein